MKARFSEEELEEAIQRVLAGESLTAVVNSSAVSRTTVKCYVAARREGQILERQRPGPAPVLSADCEEDIVTWIAAMQRRMVPVQPWEVIEAANEIRHAIHGNLRSVTDLISGWYYRFVDRHPELSMRSSEPLSRARLSTTTAAFSSLFYELTRLVIEHKLDASRIWNMDETSFISKHQSNKVLAVRGSTNVWTKTAESSFHLSVVAGICADGRSVPPLYIFPGRNVRRTALDGCNIDGSGIHTAAKGFLNGSIFERWIEHFAEAVGTNTPRPVVLLCDGCSSHLGATAVQRAKEFGVLLVFLPPNATHLIQPLDVAVFKGFKTEVRKILRRVLKSSGEMKVSKKEAVAIASRAYTEKIVNARKITRNGFRTCGISPLSFPAMEARLKKNDAGGIVRGELGLANWLRVREEVRQQILALPLSPIRKKSSRKTADASNKIMRKSDLLVTPPRKRRISNSGTAYVVPHLPIAPENDGMAITSTPGLCIPMESALV